MIMPAGPFMPVSLDNPAGIRPGRFSRIDSGALAALALGFLAFMPYPAVRIGGNSALQAGNVLTLLLILPALFLRRKRHAFYLFLLILVPLCLSAVRVMLAQEDGLDVCLKSIVVWGFSCATLVATLLYAPRYSLQLLTGIAIATLVHVLVGLWQLYSFHAGSELPLQALYVNPSFLSVQDNANIIVRYIQRPFGLYPEPSAMSSSTAPWVLLWIAELCGIVRLRQQPARWQRVLFAVAAAGGLGLIILSRSGHAMVTIAAVVVFGLVWLRKARPTVRTYLSIVVVFGIILPLVVWLTVVALRDRVAETGGANSSWEDRSNSLAIGFSLWTQGDFPTLLFGMGAGLSAPAISRAAGLEAVWSVLLPYIYETGIVGFLVVCWIARQLTRVWRASGFNLAFAAIFFVWLVGITVTTSYNQLLPIWVALGWLIVWPSVCQSVPKRGRLQASSDRLPWGLEPGRALSIDRAARFEQPIQR